MNLQKTEWGKFCNCRNSKCMKLYCQCFAARLQCNKNCHCIDCHNRNNTDHLKPYQDHINSERKTFKDELAREHKGCACRKSGCTKKYCQCYQAGLLCRDLCKCIECQNNESLSNKKVISELKRNTSSFSNRATSLYPIILTQNNRHLNQILSDENPLNIGDDWIERTAQDLYRKAKEGSVPPVIQKLLYILSSLQNQINCTKKYKIYAPQQKQENFDAGNNIQEENLKQQESQEMMQEQVQSAHQYQNLKDQQK